MQVILCRSSGIPHHAVGGSAAPLSELSLVLEEWCASSLPELCIQVGFVLVCFKCNDQKYHCGCVCLLRPLTALTHSWLMVLCSCLSFHRKAVSYYDLLGVKPDASLEEIKNAFFEKSKKVGFLFVDRPSIGNVLPEGGSIAFPTFPTVRFLIPVCFYCRLSSVNKDVGAYLPFGLA